jgi:hypothetical protein
MGTTTAGLPLRAGEHYEKCPACATVYRTKRRTRFRCPQCHALAYAIATPTGEDGRRRSVDDDEAGRIYRILDRRPGEGETPPTFGDDVVLFLEDDAADPALPDHPPARSRPGVPGGPPSPSRARAKREADRPPAPTSPPKGTGIVRRILTGSLGDWLRRG